MKRTTALVPALLLAILPGHADDRGGEVAEAVELLRQNGIAADAAGALGYLSRLRPDRPQQEEIARLVGQLADPSFARREAASKALPTFGGAAEAQVAEAATSDDPEVRSRARGVLAQLASGTELRRSLTLAALRVVQSSREASAVPVLLAILGLPGDEPVPGVAAEALWASAAPEHARLLQGALDDENLTVRAAAVVALEVAAGDDAVTRIVPLLNDDEPAIRLAAARALLDRDPRRAVEALVPLAGGDDGEIAWQADALLQMKTGHRVETGAGQALRDGWQQWHREEFPAARLDTVLGAKRLDLSAGRGTMEEGFARDAASVANGYGRFRYEADNGGSAKVADGKLRIHGNHPEGDQRLLITSRRMIGREAWPDRVEVTAVLGGEEGNNFGWHLGVSVGGVKALFHPGLDGGGFRAETTDGHDFLFPNEDMGFEPATGVMHEMTVKVTRTPAGADFDVRVKDGKGGKTYRKQFQVNAEQLGAFSRIGLERSGRTGADALFDSVAIRLGMP